MEYDLHSEVKAVVALDTEVAAGASSVGNIIDTLGFESAEFVIQSGVITAGDFTVLLEDGDNSGLSDAAVIPDVDRLGALPTFAVTADNKVAKVGSRSKKRYQRLTLIGANTPAGVMSASCILSNPKSTPTDEQAVIA